MGHSSEVKCSSRKGMTLSSNLSREEKGESEGGEERERKTGREKMYSPFTFKAHKENKAALQIHCHPQYFVYYSNCLVSL